VAEQIWKEIDALRAIRLKYLLLLLSLRHISHAMNIFFIWSVHNHILWDRTLAGSELVAHQAGDFISVVIDL
jgi:hypothetical protein